MDVSGGIEALAGVIAERAEEIEKTRHLPKDLARSLAETGAFRMLVPKAIGGLEVTPMEALAVIERAARADASTGWCVMIGATTGVTAAYLVPEVGREIYGDPLAITGGVFAPMGRAVLEGDHYRVNGHWNWASGSTHCDWLMGGAVILEDGKPRLLPNGAPDARMMIFRASEAKLPDTWFVVGQSGTGSGEMVVNDLLVPKARSVSLMVDQPTDKSPLYLFPVFGFLALGIAAVALGNGQAALDDLLALAAAKRPQGSAKSLADKNQTQVEVAKARAALSAARAFVFETVGRAWKEASKGGEISLTRRAELRLAATHAARTGAEVARNMYDLGGGSSVFLTSPLQRRFRDAHVITQHMMVAPATYELTGRVFLDLPTDATFL